MPRKTRKTRKPKDCKRDCVCGCGIYVAESTERRHLTGLGPKYIAASMQHLRERLGGGNSRSGNHRTKSSSQVSAKQRIIGRSSRPYADSLQLPNHSHGSDSVMGQVDDPHHPSPPPLQEITQNNQDTYGLSNPRRSRRVAKRVEAALHDWTQASSSRIPVREDRNDQEDARFQDNARFLEEDAVDDSHFSGDNDDDDGFLEFSPAEPGDEGIALWDLLGEGFLQEISALGIYSAFLFFDAMI